MRIFTNFGMYPSHDQVNFWGLRKFDDGIADRVLLVGDDRQKVLTRFLAENVSRDVTRFEIEEPNRFWMDGFEEVHDDPFTTRILSFCPHSAEYQNQKFKSNKWVPCFLPFDEDNIPLPQQKQFDSIYVGSVHPSPTLLEIVHALMLTNYCLVSGTKVNPANVVTHPNASYHAKLNLIAQSKVSVVHCLVGCSTGMLERMRQLNPSYRDHPGFDQLDATQLAPQMKGRFFEAAFCRSLILCRYDHWRIAERFFVPEKEFLYYEPGKLNDRLREVIADYDKYQDVVEAAYQRAVREYTTRRFFEKFF